MSLSCYGEASTSASASASTSVHTWTTGANTDDCTKCTCGECPPEKISARTATRIMYGAAQVMDDLRRESMELEAGTHLDDLDARCAYPFNWIPQHARKPQREALIGLHNILLVIYAIMEQGNIPDIETINELCAKESDSLQHVTDYIECGGSVENVLSELTSQIESDIKGEALNVDGEDLQEALQQIAPCALDDRTEYWRKAVGIA